MSDEGKNKAVRKRTRKLNPEDLWVGMPEFCQERKEAHAKIIFRFENEEDLQEFAKLIGQRLTSKTKSSWHPFKPHRREVRYEWINKT